MRRRLDPKRSATQRGEAELAAILQRIDGRGYNAYREVKGRFELRDFTLYVDHVQGDPFAAPSKLRARVPMAVAKLPEELIEGRVRRGAMEDFLARQVRDAVRACHHLHEFRVPTPFIDVKVAAEVQIDPRLEQQREKCTGVTSQLVIAQRRIHIGVKELRHEDGCTTVRRFIPTPIWCSTSWTARR